jgi:hypothetical protein
MKAVAVIGLAAMAWIFVAVYSARLRNVSGWNRDWSRALRLAALIGLTGLLVHSAFDFNLQIPANACMFYFMCAVAAAPATTPKLRSLRGTRNYSTKLVTN